MSLQCAPAVPDGLTVQWPVATIGSGFPVERLLATLRALCGINSSFDWRPRDPQQEPVWTMTYRTKRSSDVSVPESAARPQDSTIGGDLDSSSNEAGAVRRRLLRSLGGAGGLAVGTFVTGWTKPVVESVVIPAHAQTTTIGDDNGPAVCNTLSIAGTGSYTLTGSSFDSLTLGVTISGSATVYESTYELPFSFDHSDSFSLPPGSYNMVLGTTRGIISTGVAEYSISCCNNDLEVSTNLSGAGSDSGSFASLSVIMGDDGECSIALD